MDETSYSTLIHKSDTFATAKAYFEEMKQRGLTPNIVTYTTLLRKAQRAPVEETLELLEAMQTAGLKPSSGRDKKTKQVRHYTLEAVRPTVKKSQKLFKEWAKAKGSQHPTWQEFYDDCLK